MDGEAVSITWVERSDDKDALAAAIKRGGQLQQSPAPDYLFLRPDVYRMGVDGLDCTITVERRIQDGGTHLWIVADHGMILGRDGTWHIEVLPSNRTPEHIAMTRMTWNEAVTAAAYIIGMDEM